MSLADWLLLGLVATVCGALAFVATPRWVPRLFLLASALAISSLLFLPSPWLVDVVGIEFVHRLYGWSRATPWRPPEWVHLLGFAWLALSLWLARPAWRGAMLVAMLVVLAIAAELAQWLTAERTPRVDDVVVNLLGVALGLVFGMVASGLARLTSRARSPGESR